MDGANSASVAMAPGAADKLRADAPPGGGDAVATARDLTAAMRGALASRQRDLLGGAATVIGHGMTMRALRARGIVAGAMPFARVTDFGAAVLSAMEGTCDGRP